MLLSLPPSESVLFACTFANIGAYLNKQTKLVTLLSQAVMFLLSSSSLWTWSQISNLCVLSSFHSSFGSCLSFTV